MNVLCHVSSANSGSVRLAIAAAVAVALGAAAAAHAAGGTQARASRQESIGVASGFAVGAAAGGPIGAFVGAAAGAMFGDRLHRETRAHAAADRELAGLQGRSNGLATQVLFRTGDDQLRAADRELLQQFARLAAGVPGARVHVTGFADPRGASDYNAQLAARRAAGVASELAAAGLMPGRLVVDARGEDTATQPPPEATATADLDGYAFERRVEVRLELVPAGASGATQTAVAQRG